jgi:hypothetical protein
MSDNGIVNMYCVIHSTNEETCTHSSDVIYCPICLYEEQDRRSNISLTAPEDYHTTRAWFEIIFLGRKCCPHDEASALVFISTNRVERNDRAAERNLERFKSFPMHIVVWCLIPKKANDPLVVTFAVIYRTDGKKVGLEVMAYTQPGHVRFR